MKNSENSFTRELDALMRERGMNKSALARAIGGQPALISRWYAGVYPRPETIGRLAAALGVAPERLLQTLPPESYPLTPPARVASIIIREEGGGYHASPVNPICQKMAEQTVKEIRERLLTMCQASEAQRQALAAQCHTRIEEFIVSCKTH